LHLFSGESRNLKMTRYLLVRELVVVSFEEDAIKQNIVP
jgi:hypothetical protein